MHIIAYDEWRYHFDLTRIKNMASDLPASFTEVIIPGAHSDIGGGYYSRWSLRDPNYVPVINETKVIATFKSTESRYSTAKDSHAYSQATAYAKMRAAQGGRRALS